MPHPDTGEVFAVMDARCGLCSWGAKWIARHDPRREIRIVPVQSALGTALLRDNGLDPDDPSSWLFVEHGQVYLSLDAVIRLGWRLGGLSRGLVVLRVLPRKVQDWLYMRVARNRYRLFGSGDLCASQDPEVMARLVR